MKTLDTATDMYSLGPEQTPQVIRWIMALTACITLLVALIDPWLQNSLHFLLGLSWAGAIQNYFLWQPLTYFFLLPSYGGITIFLFINLAFNLYILWIFGTAIAERYGTAAFLRLYLGSGIVGGLCALGALYVSPAFLPLTGGFAPLLALFVAWTMMNPDSRLLLFFIFPVKTKWLLAGILGASFLICVSQGDLVGMTLLAAGTLFGYFTATMGWGLQSPFAFTYALDTALNDLGSRFQSRQTQKPHTYSSSKIIDLNTGVPVDDDNAFVDAMLAKISEKGEPSLSWKERRRLNQIAKDKQKQLKR